MLLQNLCAVDVSEHVAIGLTYRIAFHEVANALDPAHATPTTCLPAFSWPTAGISANRRAAWLSARRSS